MNYLVIKNNEITNVCKDSKVLLEYLEVNVTDKGYVEVGKDKTRMPTSYNMEHFTKEEVLEDLAKHQLKNIECMLQIGIFKLERVK
jgi:hypothetical protein